VLSDAPYAVDVAEMMLSLGVETSEVMSLLKPNTSWQSAWVKSAALIRYGKFSSALDIVDKDPVLSIVPHADVIKGKAFFLLGNYRQAANSLERVSMLFKRSNSLRFIFPIEGLKLMQVLIR
jgi:hypothetical protein